jgi:hypothetical protein
VERREQGEKYVIVPSRYTARDVVVQVLDGAPLLLLQQACTLGDGEVELGLRGHEEHLQEVEAGVLPRVWEGGGLVEVPVARDLGIRSACEELCRQQPYVDGDRHIRASVESTTGSVNEVQHIHGGASYVFGCGAYIMLDRPLSGTLAACVLTSTIESPLVKICPFTMVCASTASGASTRVKSVGRNMFERAKERLW